MEFTKNVEDIKLSERTKQLLIKLAAFDESFFELCELLIYKSDNEELQAAFENEAEKEQKKAMEYQANALKEMKNLIQNKMFQTFLETGYKEI